MRRIRLLDAKADATPDERKEVAALREFVDATDDLENFLMVVAAPMSFLDTNTKGRGLGRYPALYNRVYDEVRDRNLTNPLSALVRVGTPVEVAQ